MVTRYFILSYKIDDLRRWQVSHADARTLVQDTETAWKELHPVVDENDYPLELLLHVSESIPPDQLNLTLFEVGDGHLLIKGEAKNVSGAYQFLDNLKKNSHLTGYNWEMGQPQILPNDLAQLQIDGTRP